MNRYRFLIPGDDGRPMQFPPIAPFWITGCNDTHTVVVAYAPNLQTLTSESHWPDAEEIEDWGEQKITFTSRFPKPDWWR
ncbi:hypothetical protein RA27_02070 [Ruegeria sp. ANG-R]|nr:hypothetical protein RA27_02070 [Ruegeria sp. ANG-R]